MILKYLSASAAAEAETIPAVILIAANCTADWTVELTSASRNDRICRTAGVRDHQNNGRGSQAPTNELTT